MSLRPPAPVRPSPPVDSASPRSSAVFASVTVPCTVAVPVAIAGRAIVPVGGVIANSRSKLAGPVAPCPTSFSLVLSVIPFAYAPE